MKHFFVFTQNNSGGSFITDENVCHRLIIEAENEQEASNKAESLGCYWNGCDTGSDCSCCEDRWYDSADKVDLERYRTEGYPAFEYTSIYPVAYWFEKYGSYKRKADPNIKKGDTKFEQFGTYILFETIEEYAQFMSDKYGWTSPDTRIFFEDGSKKEFFASNR